MTSAALKTTSNKATLLSTKRNAAVKPKLRLEKAATAYHPNTFGETFWETILEVFYKKIGDANVKWL
jgi:hypothetical protein